MKFFKRLSEIDPSYYQPCDKKGQVERLDYLTTNYDGRTMSKHAYVYTPYGYDASKAYDILYLVHGGGETAEKYLYQGGDENPLRRAIDHMLEKGEIRPLIIVTPCEYPDNEVQDINLPFYLYVSVWHKELVNDLIPEVEKKYHTYAGLKTDPESLKKARDHRTLAGWSLGAVTSWFVFEKQLAYFHDFGFLSADCSNPFGESPISVSADGSFIQEEKNKVWADASAQFIVKRVKEQGFERKDFNIFAATGTLDIAYEGLSMLMSALLAYPDTFEFYDEKSQNIAFLTWAKGEHHTKWRLQYTINAIKQFYSK